MARMMDNSRRKLACIPPRQPMMRTTNFTGCPGFCCLTSTTRSLYLPLFSLSFVAILVFVEKNLNSMQFKKSAVFGVLIMLYLSTDSCCHYIPERKTTATSGKKNGTSSQSEQIQICGNALTNFIIEACDGIVGSFNPANSRRNSVQTKITEDCCDQECPLDYLQTYCEEAPLFTTKKTLRGKLLNKLTRSRGVGTGAAEGTPDDAKKKGGLEGANSINRTWPSIEIGTISPEIEKFGGQPIIVVRKNKSNSS